MLTPIPTPANLYAIGTQYRTRGKHPRLCIVVDVLRTYNANGQLVRVRYVAEHVGVINKVTDYDVVATTIAMGLVTAITPAS